MRPSTRSLHVHLARLAACLLLGADANPCPAQCDQELHRPPVRDEYFGVAVAVEGSTALVGAWGANPPAPGGVGTGAVRWFERDPSGWVDRGSFSPSSGVTGSRFGWSIALDGTRALVGAPWDGQVAPTSGLAYVFELAGGAWVETAVLAPSVPVVEGHFGFSVALDGDVAMIGARSSATVSDPGSAYLFELGPTGWVETQRLSPTNQVSYALYGHSVSLDGSTALVGAWWATGSMTLSGAVYAYANGASGWTEQAVLLDPVLGRGLGSAVAVLGDTAFAGSDTGEGDPTGPSQDDGVILVFERGGGVWDLVQRLHDPTPSQDSQLGGSLALDGDRLVAGGGPSAYVFDRGPGGWSQVARVSNPNLQDGASSVAASGDTVLVGNGTHTVPDPLGGPNDVIVVGFALLSDFRCPVGSSSCAAVPNSIGVPGLLSAIGSNNALSNYLRLRATQLPANEFGYFLVSRDQGLFNPPGSSGLLCLGGDIGRYNCVPCGQVQSSGLAGVMSIGAIEGLDLENLPLNNPPFATSPGDTLYFQCWFRDGSTSNFTDGLAVAYQ